MIVRASKVNLGSKLSQDIPVGAVFSGTCAVNESTFYKATADIIVDLEVTRVHYEVSSLFYVGSYQELDAVLTVSPKQK